MKVVNFKVNIMRLTILLLIIIIVSLSSFSVYADTTPHKNTLIICAIKPDMGGTIEVFKYVNNPIEA